jgi:teichuronic acid biosynthesis glycosyltransferase TuaC
MRILFISNLYPNPVHPAMGMYNYQQIKALSDLAEVTIASPLPWTGLVQKPRCLRSLREKIEPVLHPVYFYTPRAFRRWYGHFFHLSIKPAIERLFAKQSFDLIYSSWLYPDAWGAARLAREYKVPLFVKVHGTDVNNLKPGTAITRRCLEVVDQAEKVFCVSAALKAKLTELGFPEQKLEVLYNGVDRAIFYRRSRDEVRHELGLDPAESVVLYVGNVKPEKGIDELVDAFKIVTSRSGFRARLIIVGAGPYLPTVHARVRSLHLCEKVEFLGSQTLDKVALWMNAADLLCLPSYMEGTPNVILEALACQTPVVATNVGGIPELDDGRGNLALVEPRDPDSLAQALGDMLKRRPKPVSASFISSWEQNAATLMQFFEVKTERRGGDAN